MTENNGGVIGAAASVSKSLIGSLAPHPALLGLVLVNIAFIAFLMWFLEDQLTQRDMMAEKLFNRCLELALPNAP